MPSNKKKLLWCAVAFLATPLLLECAARVRGHIKYGSNQNVFDLYRRDPETGLRMPIPGLSRTLAKTAKIEIDSRGFRNPEFEHPKPPRTVRLAFLGASPTFCVEVAGNEETWPHLATRALARSHPQIRFDYLNAAVSAYGIAESKLRLVHSVAPFDPDIIVIYHATRDLSIDVHRLAVAAGLESEPQPSSWLEDHSLLWRQIRLNLQYLADQKRGRGTVGKLTVDAALLAKAFGQRLGELLDEARRIADVVVVVTFAIRGRRDQPEALLLDNMAHAFTFAPYLSATTLLDCYDAYNAAARDAARQAGVVVLEGATALPGTAAYFVDSVHLTAEGCQVMAGLVSDGLQRDVQFRELLEQSSKRPTP